MSVAEAPWLIISVLKAVCNAMARISPSAAAPTRAIGPFRAENASAKPMDADAASRAAAGADGGAGNGAGLLARASARVRAA